MAHLRVLVHREGKPVAGAGAGGVGEPAAAEAGVRVSDGVSEQRLEHVEKLRRRHEVEDLLAARPNAVALLDVERREAQRRALLASLVQLLEHIEQVPVERRAGRRGLRAHASRDGVHLLLEPPIIPPSSGAEKSEGSATQPCRS